MKFVFLVVCLLGALCSFSAFREECDSGKLYPSLLFASIGWSVAFAAILIFWKD